MKRKIFQTINFGKIVDKLLKKNVLRKDDFYNFQKELAERPYLGDIIPGTNGVRKIRLKSANKGKRGSFRVCYYYLVVEELIYLLFIYAKSEQENLTTEEKNLLREFVITLKRS